MLLLTFRKSSSRPPVSGASSDKAVVVAVSVPSTGSSSELAAPQARVRSTSTGSRYTLSVCCTVRPLLSTPVCSPQVQGKGSQQKHSVTVEKAASLSDLSREPPTVQEPPSVVKERLERFPTVQKPPSIVEKPLLTVEEPSPTVQEPPPVKPVHPKQSKNEPNLSAKEKKSKRVSV